MISFTIPTMQALIGIVSSLFGFYVYYLIYSAFWEKANWKMSQLVVLYILELAAGFIAATFSNFNVNMIVGMLTCFYMALPYKNKFTDRLLMSLLVFGIFFLLEGTTGLILTLIFGDQMKMLLESNIAFYLSGTIISRMLFYISARLIKIFKIRNVNQITLKTIISVLFLPVSLILCSFIIINISINIQDQKILFAISFFLFMLTIVYMYVIFIVDRQSELEITRQRLFFLEKQAYSQVGYYRDLFQQQTEIRKMKHDMLNILLPLSGMVKAGKNQEVQDYLNNINSNLKSVPTLPETKFVSLNTVLALKQNVAKKSGIDFSYQIFLSELKVNEIDFCILIANALDNALEACQRIPIDLNLKPKIRLCIKERGNHLTIEVENTCIKELNDFPDQKTWKEDAKNHGLGLETMKSISEKYQGNLLCYQQDSLFFLSVLLNNKEV